MPSKIYKKLNDYFNYLYSLERISIKYNLENITKLCNIIGKPQNNFKSIHIAGTNGKGATASFCASVLQEHNFKTGLYTSPHILNFNERIKINGIPISNNYIFNFIDTYYDLIQNIKPSFFEVTTAIAFKYFSDNNVDFAVIECGMGGRLDSTNIITPDICIITQIGLDHKIYLGNTLTKIAKEKFGIIKLNAKTIISDNNPKLIKLIDKYSKNYDIFYLDKHLKISIKEHKNKKTYYYLNFINSKYSRIKLTSPLLGNYQLINIASAYCAINELFKKYNYKFNFKSFLKGVSNVKINTGYWGRLDKIKFGNNFLYIDVSHNPEAIQNTLNTLNNSNIIIDLVVFAMMDDKDYQKSLRIISKLKCDIIFTKPDYHRAISPYILSQYLTRLNYKNNIYNTKNIKEAISYIKRYNKINILCIGSFFLVSDILKTIGFKKINQLNSI